jgi:hypothetical protein
MRQLIDTLSLRFDIMIRIPPPSQPTKKLFKFTFLALYLHHLINATRRATIFLET